jgi:hypothetical protein
MTVFKSGPPESGPILNRGLLPQKEDFQSKEEKMPFTTKGTKFTKKD